MEKRKREDTQIKIKGVSGIFAGQEYLVQKSEEVTVGRDETKCNLVIISDVISRRHCSVEFHSLTGMYKVTDHSVNGTYADDRRRLLKEESKFLPRGTVLSLGTSKNRIKLC